MSAPQGTLPGPAPTVEHLTSLSGPDLIDLCDAAVAAIADGGGFGWVQPPPRQTMEKYWQGVLLVPERELFVSRLDGVICGSAQFVRPPRNNEAQSFAAQISGTFVAPWARGRGNARLLTLAIEKAAAARGFRVLNLDIRETQSAAIALYESLGFERWGTHPRYAFVEGRMIAGHYYTKELRPSAEAAASDKGAGDA